MSKAAEINRLHKMAMEAANEGYVADLKGAFELAQQKFRVAFENESKAALSLQHDLDAEPSRSVLFRSAATLGIDCGEFREAERLVAMGLAGNPPDEICEELRDALERIHSASTRSRGNANPLGSRRNDQRGQQPPLADRRLS